MLQNNDLLLGQRLEELRGYIDVVIVDTSPTPNALNAMVYQASDAVICPTTCEALSLEGLASSRKHLLKASAARVGSGLPEIELLGVLPTMWQSTRAHDYGMELIEKAYGKSTLPAIAQRTIWRDQSYARKTLFVYAPKHGATAEINRAVERVYQYVA